jgi:hypothetical protein
LVLDVIRALGRRWYLVVLGAIATAALVLAAYISSPPAYNARALVLLFPSTSAVGERGNPLLALGGLEQPAGVLVAYLSSDAAREEVEQRSETAEYLIRIDDSTRGPVIAVDVSDTDSQRALNTLGFILDRIPQGLAELQEQVDAPAEAAITSMQLTVDEEAERDIGGTVRIVIAALVVGVAGTCATAFALDGLLGRRRLSARDALPAPRPRLGPDAVPAAEQSRATGPDGAERASAKASVGT